MIFLLFWLFLALLFVYCIVRFFIALLRLAFVLLTSGFFWALMGGCVIALSLYGR